MSRVLYLCNAGVLIESGGKKILMDVLVPNSRTMFRDIAPKRLEAILHGAPPFDDIDVLCVTHLHPDHCDPDTLATFVRRFPEVPVICCPETADVLRSRSHGAGTVIVPNPTQGNGLSVRVADMDIVAVNLPHEGNRFAEIENFGYILPLEHTFIHPGDAASTDANMLALAAHLPPKNPDAPEDDTSGTRVLLAPFPYLTLPAAFTRVQRALTPDHFLTFHLPDPEEDQGRWIAAARNGLRKRGNENTRLLEREGEWFEFE